MKKALIIIVLVLIAQWGKAQTHTVNSLVTSTTKYLESNVAEKLYLQLDKTNYGVNDTLRFKAYLFNASFFKASAKSNIVYIELSDENNLVQMRCMVQLTNGLGNGSIVLNKRDFPQGGYTLRAYTQWMRNFDERLIFKQQFYVSNIDRYKWLINYTSAIKDNIAQLHLQLLGTNKRPITNQQVLLGIRQDDVILRRDKPELTSIFGGLDAAVSVKDKTTPVYASLHKGSYDDVNEQVYKFPIIYNRPEKTDVQFMPEGGYLVAGISSRIGVKAIGENGKGVNISGKIVNSITNQQVAAFDASDKGMGSLDFNPQAGMIYKAIVELPTGLKKEYPFPVVKATGTVLNIINNPQADSVILRITASPWQNSNYLLLGQSREQVCFGAKVILENNTKTIKAPKSAFATGITRFTLLNDQLQTLNERIVYINQQDDLKIIVTPHKKSYATQDSIALDIEVKDKNNSPVQGNFSMSVVNAQLDNNQTKNSIITNLLLTSDLKGDVDDPVYYLTKGHEKQLDNLLLTQGWTEFEWKDVIQPKKKAFKPELGYDISGKVDNLFGKPVKGASINLMSLRPLITDHTDSDELGNFEFSELPLADSAAFFLNPINAKGKKSTYDITLDKPQWPVFSKNKLQMPWYVNTDTTILNRIDTVLINQNQADKLTGMGNVLQEVTIKEKRVIRNSFNLNGPGEADQVIDSRDIEKMPKTSLLELLKRSVNGFRAQGNRPALRLFINGNEIIGLIFDGINAERVMSWGQVLELLDYYTSDDIAGIEVMEQYYGSKYLLEFYPGRSPRTAFLEITTKGGDGPFMKKVNGFVMHRPPVLISPKKFYRPRYIVKNAVAAALDERSTIHWEPNVIIAKDGKATVSFYAAGQPATYTVNIEGSNMDGNMGTSVYKVIVK